MIAPVLCFIFRRTQKKVRPLDLKQNERHAQQQVGVLGRLLQRDREILLQSADAVEHGVAVGIERVAGLFQRVVAGEVMVERFAVLRALFAVVNGKAAKLRRNKVAPALQIFQQQRCAQLLRRADGFAVEARIPHQLQRLARRAVELRKGEKIVDRRGDEDLELKFLRKLGKDVAISLPVKEEKNIALI